MINAYAIKYKTDSVIILLLSPVILMVRAAGLEPARINLQILSLLRLPFRHARQFIMIGPYPVLPTDQE